MTVAKYNRATGLLNPTLPCLNCSQTNGRDAMCPSVALTTQRGNRRNRNNKRGTTKNGGPTPLAAISTISETNQEAAVVLMDLSTYTELNRFTLDYSMGKGLAVTVTNYPLGSAFYYVPRTKRHYLYTAFGTVVVNGVSGTNGASHRVALPVSDFEATCLDVDEFNGVLVVAGTVKNDTHTNNVEQVGRSMVAVYDLASSPEQPQLRVASMVEGRVLSVTANAGKVAYVTAEFPGIATYNMTSSSTTTTSPPSASVAPSMALSLAQGLQPNKTPTFPPTTAPLARLPPTTLQPSPTTLQPTPRPSPASTSTSTTVVNNSATGSASAVSSLVTAFWGMVLLLLFCWS